LACIKLDTEIDNVLYVVVGFMQGRLVILGRLILDMVDYNNFIEDASFILFIDFYKAFDTLNHFIFQFYFQSYYIDRFWRCIFESSQNIIQWL